MSFATNGIADERLGVDIYLDANAIILAFEGGAASLRTFLVGSAAGQHSMVTSELTIAETLVVPLRVRNDALVSFYSKVFERFPFRLIPITQPILRMAAAVRAERAGIKLADAVHVASARHASCEAFITDDKQLLTLPGTMVPVGDAATLLGRA